MESKTREKLLAAAGIAVNQCLSVQPGEQVLVVTDPICRSIAEALYEAAVQVRAEALLLMMEPRQANGEEPPVMVALAMRWADVCFCPTSKSLTHTVARREATKKGARIASMPGITEDIMARALKADYEEICELTAKLKAQLESETQVRITSSVGTDLTLDFSGRALVEDTGLYREKGRWGNLPAGEVYVAPNEGTAQGRVVIDGSLAGIGMLSSPVIIEIKEGRAVSFKGAEAERLREILDAAGPDGRMLAEMGIGTNPSARLVGHVLEDEKVLGTVHVAFGANASFGGKIQVPCHIDGIMQHPTLIVGDKVLLSDGELKLS